MDEKKCKQCKHHSTKVIWGRNEVCCTADPHWIMSVALVVECPGFEPLQPGKVTEEEIWKAIPEGNGLWTAGKLVTEGTLQYYELATDLNGQKRVWRTKEEAEQFCTIMLSVDKVWRMRSHE